VRLVFPIGGATSGSGNLSTSLSNVARLTAHPKFVWVFNANCDGTIIYNDPVYGATIIEHELFYKYGECRYILHFIRGRRSKAHREIIQLKKIK
jgi:hypothetical protein